MDGDELTIAPRAQPAIPDEQGVDFVTYGVDTSFSRDHEDAAVAATQLYEDLPWLKPEQVERFLGIATPGRNEWRTNEYRR